MQQIQLELDIQFNAGAASRISVVVQPLAFAVNGGDRLTLNGWYIYFSSSDGYSFYGPSDMRLKTL
jgi:hypothetical protein